MTIDLRNNSGNTQTRLEQHSQNNKTALTKGFQKNNSLLESPHDMLIEENSRDVLVHWKGPEFEVYPKDHRWYLIATLILTAIIAYAVITDSPLMAITFILIGIVGYIHTQKEPRALDFKVAHDGIMVGKEIFEYGNVRSFWIFYEPPHTKILSLHTEGKLIPFVHIPIHQEDPVKIREELLKFLPEIEQEHSFVDTLERLLHI